MQIARSEVTSVLEAAHDGDASLQAWLDRLVDASRRIQSSAAMVVAAIVQRHAERYTLVAGDTAAHGVGPLAEFGRMLPQLDATALDAYYRRPERLATHSDIRREDPLAAAVGDAFVQNLGLADSVALIAQAGDGVSMVLFALSERKIVLTPADRLVLARVSAHVEATLRTRVGDGAPLAVLSSEGQLVHAEDDARGDTVRDALEQHVRDVERSRSRAQRGDAERVTSTWTALVEGRYGLVERDVGGRREYHVIAHPAHVWGGRQLTDLEARVLELSARGLSGKLVSYSLGISEAAVSTALARAAEKLGSGSRTELVALAASVLAPAGLRASGEGLTTAEREVLASLRLGWSNAAIAQARGASEHTVANQVRSLLVKTGLGSRRALAALGPSTDEPD